MNIVYGIHPVRLALQSKRRVIQSLFLKNNSGDNTTLNKIHETADGLDIPVKLVSTNALSYMTNKGVHQGVCIKASNLEYDELSPDSLKNPDKHAGPKLWILLNHVHDPMNYGAVLRSCYFFGVDKILSFSEGSCGLTSVVSKASAGVMEIVNITKIDNLLSFMDASKQYGWNVIGTVSYNSDYEMHNVADYTLKKSSILIIGNEGHGLSSEILKYCDDLVSLIPRKNLLDGVDSLNVSVATGAILHSLLSKK